MNSKSNGPGWPRSTDQPIMSRPLLPTELRALTAESIGPRRRHPGAPKFGRTRVG
jgi:hypothetical protein